MKLEDCDTELNRLHEAGERIAANLVELEIDSSRQLLEASTLTGESAARWSAASAALTELWEWRGQLESLLEGARERRRSPRRPDELYAFLTGPSIELTRAQVPLAERSLLGTPEIAVRCTANELLARMSGAFDEVKAAVAGFARAWETLTPRLAEARTALERARTLAAAQGESDHDLDLDEAAQRLSALTAQLSTDPLAVAPPEVERLIDSLQTIERDLQAGAALRRELDARLSDARARLARLRIAVEECQCAHDELLVKISVPSAPGAPELRGDVSSELDDVGALARAGAWREARRRLDGWNNRTSTLLDEAQRTLQANRAPVEARNQLRALLEAYQVKAGRVGAIEDPELERIGSQAHEVLYTAPTDLTLAAQLVRRYQELLNVPRPAGEVLR
jgi:hypothetical protein